MTDRETAFPDWGPRAPRTDKPIFGGALPFGVPETVAPGGYSSGPQVSNYSDEKFARHVASGAQPQNFTHSTRFDSGGGSDNLNYTIVHGTAGWKTPAQGNKPSFILVKDAGSGEADGIYKPSSRKWEGMDVLESRHGDCIISREAHKSPKTGEVKYGFVLGKDGHPYYGVKTQKLEVPTKGWKAFQGLEPVPEIQIFQTWSDCCQNGAWYFAQEAGNAAKGGHWKAVLLLADRAFDCHTLARPKGRGDARTGGMEWAAQLCELLGTRADALLHLGEFKKALVDACAAVHFVPSFDWTRAQTRGVTACLNLGVEEEQAKLLIAEFCRRTDREFPGVQHLEPLVEELLGKARQGELQKMQLTSNDVPDDGRIYFKVIDPDECKLYARPKFDAKVVGRRNLHDIVRGQEIQKNGTWLELHVSEAFDDSGGVKTAYVPLFTEDTINEKDEQDRDDILERLQPKQYPRPTAWEKLGLLVRPGGLKPPSDFDVPFSYSKWKDPPREKSQKPWPYVYKHGLALACMLRGAPTKVIDSFLRYHWGIGFNHIFLFFDDPQDMAIAPLREYDELLKKKDLQGITMSIHPMDANWWHEARAKSRYYLRREKSDMFETVCKLADKQDVESKQIIAFDMAILQAHDMGIDWFAHVDIDECIYIPKTVENSARRFFGAQPRSVECVRLFNHEAVPEKLECEDWFRECTLFQMNRSLCRGFKPVREYDVILRKREGKEFEPDIASKDSEWFDKVMAKVHLRRQAAAKAIDVRLPGTGKRLCLDHLELPAGTTASKLVETFWHFTAYECGKSVVRLDPHLRPALPLGVHSFLQDSGELFKEYPQSSDAVILHYPNASFSHWMLKYEAAGGIPTTRNGQPNPMRFHVASSEVVLHRPPRDQELFYKTFVMQNEHSELATLAEYGVVQRIDAVRSLLEWFDEEHETPEQLPGQVKWFAPNGIQFGGVR